MKVVTAIGLFMELSGFVFLWVVYGFMTAVAVWLCVTGTNFQTHGFLRGRGIT